MARTPTSVNLSDGERAQLKALMAWWNFESQAEAVRFLIRMAYIKNQPKETDETS